MSKIFTLAQAAGTAAPAHPATSHAASTAAGATIAGVTVSVGVFLLFVAWYLMRVQGSHSWWALGAAMGAGAGLVGGTITTIELTIGGAALQACVTIVQSVIQIFQK
jgi:hypothetical protein